MFSTGWRVTLWTLYRWSTGPAMLAFGGGLVVVDALTLLWWPVFKAAKYVALYAVEYTLSAELALWAAVGLRWLWPRMKDPAVPCTCGAEIGCVHEAL